MSRSMGRSLSTDWDRLTKQLEKGKPAKAAPTHLPLGAIRLWPKVFQHRTHGAWQSTAHIKKLADSVNKSRSRTLDPVTVWWDGKSWACVDGHHRHAAYRLAEVGHDHAVPVEVFEGTLAQAMAAAGAANSKDKLSMSKMERSNTAWRLTVSTTLSKAETAAASGVSEGTVSSMRRVHKLLTASTEDIADDLSLVKETDLRDMSWTQAQQHAKGAFNDVRDWDELNRKKAQVMATALTKALGREASKYPEVFAMALDLYDSRLSEALMEWWGSD